MRFLLTGIALVVVLTAHIYGGQYQQKVVLKEDRALTLPNGHKIVMTDDDEGSGKNRGIELFDGHKLRKIAQNRSIQIGEFSIKCLRYDMDGDRAEVLISGPKHPPRPRMVPRIVPRRIIHTRRPVPHIIPRIEPRVKKPKTSSQYKGSRWDKLLGQKPSATPRKPTTRPAADKPNAETAKWLSKTVEKMKWNQVSDKEYVAFEQYKNKVGSSQRNEYWVLRGLYAYRVGQNKYDDRRWKKMAIDDLKKVSSLSRDKAFSIHPALWSAGSKTLWDLEIQKKEK